MNATRIFKAAALSALLLAGSAGAALAQGQLVSGEPYPGFFEGVRVPANGPRQTDEVATEAPGRLVKVEGRAIRMDNLDAVQVAEISPEAFIGVPADLDRAPTAFVKAHGESETN